MDVPELSYRHMILGGKSPVGAVQGPGRTEAHHGMEAPGSVQLGLLSPFTVTELRKMFPSLGECPCHEHLSHLPHCTEMTHGCRSDVRPEGNEDSSGLLAHGEITCVHGLCCPEWRLLHRSRAALFQRRAAEPAPPPPPPQEIMGLVCCKLI